MVSFPIVLCGKVVRGFGRGSKELNIPTANMDQQAVNMIPPDFKIGVYYGIAQVDESPFYKMVMSVGYNPFYKNKNMTAEVHIIHSFDDDFYGSTLRVAVIGYIRPEMNFNSKEDLIDTIKSDIEYAVKLLNNTECQKLLNDPDLFKKCKEINPLVENGTTSTDSSVRNGI